MSVVLARPIGPQLAARRFGRAPSRAARRAWREAWIGARTMGRRDRRRGGGAASGIGTCGRDASGLAEGQAVAAQGERAQALAGGGEDGVGQGRDDGDRADLAGAAEGEDAAVDEV